MAFVEKRFTHHLDSGLGLLKTITGVAVASFHSLGVFFCFGHLKFAKSSENGRLRREKFQLPKEWEF